MTDLLVVVMVEIEIVPAILVKTREELLARLRSVPSAPILQIDLMDDIFVPNKTIGIEELENSLPDKEIEYHLMVDEPLEWIRALPDGPKQIFQVHIESLKNDEEIAQLKKLVDSKGSKLCWAINPPTPIQRLEDHIDGVDEVLVMTVNPGFSGQSYIKECEQKMSWLRQRYPGLIIEVDGGVTKETARGAIDAGANRLAAASALFRQDDPDKAMLDFREYANDI